MSGHVMAELIGAVAQFIGVSIVALISVTTVRIALMFLGPEGVERVREARMKADRETQSPKEGL